MSEIYFPPFRREYKGGRFCESGNDKINYFMLTHEPIIKVGILENRTEVSGKFQGSFSIEGKKIEGEFFIKIFNEEIVLSDNVQKIFSGKEIICIPLNNESTFSLYDVVIGVNFHWERKETQIFQGNLKFIIANNNTIIVINEISLEKYLASVISSEMNAKAPLELLKAHAITSRSWLAAMLKQKEETSNIGISSQRNYETENEIIRWYDREDHPFFDVCADDHCQRYQGITKIISSSVQKAIDETWGKFLVSENHICDARFSKCCGGISEAFENVWEFTSIPYLTSITDSPISYNLITTEEEVKQWILSNPVAYCNTQDKNILQQILPSFDRETKNFFRWKIEYEIEELSNLIKQKPGIDFGIISNLIPIQRGPSGRIIKLKIEGSKKTVVVGKELEIRRWLSKTHLYSSAFIVEKHNNKFIFHGAGWGHGVGLCQIGAAVMATQNFPAEKILQHYFRTAKIQKLY